MEVCAWLRSRARAASDARKNAELPAEEMHRLDEGANLGWPYTYWDPIQNARVLAPEYGGDGRKRPDEEYRKPVMAFPAHWAPMQMAFNGGGNFPARYHGGAFIAFHGSWNRSKLSGYKVVRIRFDDKGKLEKNAYEEFVSGWLPNPDSNEVWGRPVGLLIHSDGSLLITDDGARKIWRVSYGK